MYVPALTASVVPGASAPANEVVPPGTAVPFPVIVKSEAQRQNLNLVNVLDIQKGMENRGQTFRPYRIYQFCNLEMVSLTALEDQTEIEFVKDMIFRHAEQTGSRRATEILLAWDRFFGTIVRVLPNDYARALEKVAVAHA